MKDLTFKLLNDANNLARCIGSSPVRVGIETYECLPVWEAKSVCSGVPIAREIGNTPSEALEQLIVKMRWVVQDRITELRQKADDIEKALNKIK